VLDDDEFFGVVDGVKDFFDVALFSQGAGGAGEDALAAVDAGGDVESVVEGGADECSAASADEVDGGDALDFFADAYASSAEDAFGGVADDGGA